MQCPNCGETSIDNSAYCRKCGTPLPAPGAGPLPGVGSKTGSAAQGGTIQPPPNTPSPTSAPGNAGQQFQTLGQLIQRYPGTRKPGPLNFWRRMRCPFCNAEFHPSDCAVHAGRRYDEQNPKASELYPAPQDNFSRFLARLHTRELTGEVNLREDARRQCPTCKHLLPYRLEVDACFTIAIVGNGSSGKSHYLAALLTQLKNGEMSHNPDTFVRFTPLTKQTERLFNELQKKLFQEKSVLPINARYAQAPNRRYVEHEPLIFQLHIIYGQKSQKIVSTMNLIFYDLSGEDIATYDALREYGWPITTSQAIIHIADPLSMPAILAKLPPTPQVEEAKALGYRGKAHEVLSQVIAQLQRGKKLNIGQSLPTPTAIMLSKSDVLDPIAAQYGFANARFLADATYDGSINAEDVQAVDRDVRDLLQNMQETALLSASQMFSDVSFFAASATGCAPDQQHHYATIKPRRCLDAFLWVLGQLTETRRRSHKA